MGSYRKNSGDLLSLTLFHSHNKYIIAIMNAPHMFQSIRESIIFMVGHGISPAQLEQMGLAKELIINM